MEHKHEWVEEGDGDRCRLCGLYQPVMPTVFNKHSDKIPPDAIYVGRPSKWGNPFFVGPDTREVVVAKYKKWLDNQIAKGWLDPEELRGKDLVCWCAPLPCHADVLLELANK